MRGRPPRSRCASVTARRHPDAMPWSMLPSVSPIMTSAFDIPARVKSAGDACRILGEGSWMLGALFGDVVYYFIVIELQSNGADN